MYKGTQRIVDPNAPESIYESNSEKPFIGFEDGQESYANTSKISPQDQQSIYAPSPRNKRITVEQIVKQAIEPKDKARKQ